MSFEELVEYGVKHGASDLHISAGQKPFIRVEGELMAASNVELTLDDFRIIQETAHRRFSAFTSNDERGLLDDDFSIEVPHLDSDSSTSIRLRANYCVRLGRPSLTLRFIRPLCGSIDTLGLPPMLHKIATLRRGIFLVTGPTGQGKTTTLAALVDEINRTRHVKIVTVEDPIEFLFTPMKALIWQREIGSDTDTFANALKHVLRQDPDIIVIGELRDLETIAAAVTAAETGHLVFATLHTADAAQSIDRIVDVFPPHQQQQIRIQLSMSLVGICSQQLVPGLDGKRACAAEIMMAHPAVRSSIREGKTAQIHTVLQTNSALGMRTMDQALADLVKRGKIDRTTAMSYAVEPQELQHLI